MCIEDFGGRPFSWPVYRFAVLVFYILNGMRYRYELFYRSAHSQFA